MNRGASPDPRHDTPDRRYSFVSRWSLAHPPERVWSVLEELLREDDSFVWWDDLQVLGRTEDEIDVVTRSGLGYRLRFRLHSLWSEPPAGLGFAADGDLVGEGRLRFDRTADGAAVLHIGWHVDASPWWMRWFGPLLRPVFVLTHAWVMRRGHRDLDAWLARHHSG